MKLIKAKAELLKQQKGINGILRHIELCGRTAYKSEDKITETSAKGFVERMMKSNHGAVLEHGTVYLTIPLYGPLSDDYYTYKMQLIRFFESNPYSIVKESKEYSETKVDLFGFKMAAKKIKILYLVTTNARVIYENNLIKRVSEYITEPTDMHEKRYTFKFTVDRGISHELVRHRVFSFVQESTRYCNYSKDKFNNEITFIQPEWDTSLKSDKYGEDRSLPFFLHEAETLYNRLINEYKWTPQQARMILPNCLKTELCMTGFEKDWKQLFDLRLFEKTGKVHPDMKYIMEKAYKTLNQK